jgi:phage terminase Nu1 subunit (DNA packaging protein)
MKQTDFATLVGISQPAVSNLVKDGVLQGNTMGEWIKSYCAHLREVAAGRLGSQNGALDLVAERARLAKVSADLRELQLATRRNELAPVGDMEIILAAVGVRIGKLLDLVPVIIRRRLPNTPAEVVEAIGNEIAKARNELSGLSLAAQSADIFADADNIPLPLSEEPDEDTDDDKILFDA